MKRTARINQISSLVMLNIWFPLFGIIIAAFLYMLDNILIKKKLKQFMWLPWLFQKSSCVGFCPRKPRLPWWHVHPISCCRWCHFSLTQALNMFSFLWILERADSVISPHTRFDLHWRLHSQSCQAVTNLFSWLIEFCDVIGGIIVVTWEASIICSIAAFTGFIYYILHSFSMPDNLKFCYC